jgi:hypothetical protein
MLAASSEPRVRVARPERFELPTLWFEAVGTGTLSAFCGVAYGRSCYLPLLSIVRKLYIGFQTVWPRTLSLASWDCFSLCVGTCPCPANLVQVSRRRVATTVQKARKTLELRSVAAVRAFQTATRCEMSKLANSRENTRNRISASGEPPRISDSESFELCVDKVHYISRLTRLNRVTVEQP